MESSQRIDAALLDAACRLRETQRPDHILNDPFAAVLLADHGKARYAADTDPATSFIRAVGIETVDDVLQHAVRHHHIHTVADLAAGLKDLVERMPNIFNHWVADNILIQPQSNPIVENTEERIGRTPIAPAVILDAFERGRWRSIQFLPVKDRAIRLDRERAAGLHITVSDAEHQGVWLFQRGG